MDEKKNINDLPDEILVEIFSYLSVEDLVLQVRHVSNRWGEVVKDSRLWKHLTYRPAYRYTESHIIDFLKQAPNLRWFVPQYRYTTGRLLEAVIKYCKNIRELELCISKSDYCLVEKLVLECRNVEYLSIIGDDFAETNALQIISKCTKLKSLRLIGYVTTQKRNIFVDISRGCPSLERLDLRYLTHYNNEDLERLLKQKKNTIISLYLYCCNEGQKCSLPVIFESCPRLQLLHVNGHGGGPYADDFASFKNMRNLKTLSMLDFRCSNVNSVSEYFETGSVYNLVNLDLSSFENFGKRLAQAIFTKCSNLQDLNLGDCRKLTDECLESIGNLRNLENLHMDGCEAITDNGVTYIVRCTKLKYLNLNDCDKITNESFLLCCMHLKMLRELQMNACKVESNSLLLIPEELKNLRTLSIHMKGLKRRVIRIMKETMPKLHIQLEQD
ncbi:hypothetical protein R5R35_008678 [Gryllus longicercus]|uniref:F-box domain-containing protein n=1 Tax=Gryllus longicercus TaxID=2509291 RepID=A0AAN9V5R2_9ORTH|nr:Uncharacterized protein GBIM_16917 [Gryllus bimaculatus]